MFDTTPIQANSALESRRFGRVSFSNDIMREAPVLLKRLYAKLIPTSVVFDYATDYFDVVGLCDEFDSLEDGELIPNYKIQIKIKKSKGKPTYLLSFDRLDD